MARRDDQGGVKKLRGDADMRRGHEGSAVLFRQGPGFLHLRIYSHEPTYTLSLLLVSKQRKDFLYPLWEEDGGG